MIMKKLIYNIALVGLLAGGLTSCQSDKLGEGQGKVTFTLSLDDDVKLYSRAAAENSEELAKNCTIYVYNSAETLVRKYHGIDEVPAEIWLVSDNYRAEAWAGKKTAASFTDKYYRGVQPFTVSNEGTQTVAINCTVANTVASVNMTPEAAAMLADYTVTIGNAKGSLDFDANNTDAKGYYMMGNNETSLTWTLTGTQPNGTIYSQEGTIDNVKAATEYRLTFKYNGVDTEIGGAMFTVTVDESTIDIEDNITIMAAPRITCSGYNDFKEPVVLEKNQFRQAVIYVSSPTQLSALKISSEAFTTKFGLSYNSYNFNLMDESAKAELAAKGITLTDATPADANGGSLAKLIFTKDLLNSSLNENGEYAITIEATDARSTDASLCKTSTAVWNIEVTDAYLMTSDAAFADVKQYSATIRGTILKDAATGIKLQYIEDGGSVWNDVEPTIEGTALSAKLTGLTPLTTYRFRATCNEYTAKEKTFTTGSAVALTNGGFEDWFTDSDDALVPSAGSGSNLFWDCGNHGSITLNVNITNPETSFVHGGSKSIKMSSKYVNLAGIGKFAAGNAFIGQYLATNGTDGILGFGRPFTSRPKALRGYCRYISKKIDNITNDGKSNGAVKGENDRGIVYVAMFDGTTDTYTYKGNPYTWPMVIRTKNKERLFSKTDERVIGYGEIIWTESTAGENWIQFEVPITYNRDVNPSAMLIVCSASYWGDFFTGGDGSTLYLDDLELVYE